MKQWTESDLNLYLRILAKNDTHDVAMSLFVVADIHRELQPLPQPMPTGNAKVITYLEQLVEDRRGCIVHFQEPEAFGELRWLAARVLACEYAYQGIETPIMLEDVVQPIRSYEIVPIHRTKTIDELMQQGRLPTQTEIIKPQDYADCCSKEAVEERKRNQDKDD